MRKPVSVAALAVVLFLRDASAQAPDSDGDGVVDGADKCPCTPESAPRDRDGDGMGDSCDPAPDTAVSRPALPTDEDSDGDAVRDDEDNCPESGNPSQLDSDGDRVGDACDTCVCKSNPVDDTGQQPQCVNGPGGADAGPEPPAPGARCVDGKIIGVAFKRLLWFARPMAAAYAGSFSLDDSRWTAGLHAFVLVNLDGWACSEGRAPAGSKRPIEITSEPEWYLRGGFYRDVSIGDRETLGGEVGVDYASARRLFTWGCQVQVMATDDANSEPELHLGVGLKAALLDAVGIVPFVQRDVRGSFGTSVGAYLIVDLGVFTDLGFHRQVVEDALRAD